MLWMNGYGLNCVKFIMCCYYNSKSREVTQSAVILSETKSSGTVRTTRHRSWVPTVHALS